MVKSLTSSTRGPVWTKNLATGLAPVDLGIFWGFSLVNSAIPNYPLSSQEDMVSEISQFVQFSMFHYFTSVSILQTNPHLAVHQPYHMILEETVLSNVYLECYCAFWQHLNAIWTIHLQVAHMKTWKTGS